MKQLCSACLGWPWTNSHVAEEFGPIPQITLFHSNMKGKNVYELYSLRQNARSHHTDTQISFRKYSGLPTLRHKIALENILNECKCKDAVGCIQF